ncbi:response regulator [Bradyrhizobium sp. SSBR45G]|uniref:response regulator n=1 Tax=unclassified Bradyrhizobium TaxID=2631580 RepID=UPI002342AE27|nr:MULTISPECIES: response regulator [unclassified Bradyrhizobium]GLH81262.1 response regulator [Bradyrhizobium sp. SSBR45G]GLH88718.1 response regulator [Bradyrhizobium sp. SSBR45R]
MIAGATESARELTILVVDDDDGDARSVQRAFRSARIINPLLRAFDGADALDILRGTNGKTKVSSPYILLVDINMPRMNGIELVKELRLDSSLNRTIVFILTTSSRDEDVFASYDLNVAGYILKERVGEDFQKLVELMRGYWRIVELP